MTVLSNLLDSKLNSEMDLKSGESSSLNYSSSPVNAYPGSRVGIDSVDILYKE